MINSEKLKLAIDYFVQRPAMLEKSSGKFINGTHAAQIFLNESREFVYKAKEEARKIVHAKEVASLQEIIDDKDKQLAKYVGSEVNGDSTLKKYETTRPLSPKEIEELVQAGANTYVARVWEKLLPSGIWTYSIDVRYRVKDFYSDKELEAKLKQLMPEIQPFTKSNAKAIKPANKALMVCIADDHVGAVNTTNLFGNKAISYEERLMLVADEIEKLDTTFEELHIISLGDQLNGWNSQTTRGGHEVLSLSNEDQFDIYVKARIAFYNRIFSSGVAATYFVKDVDNSNHSGKGMSYMANKAIELYLDARFPSVYRASIREMLDGFQYGEHVIILGHGKDEKFQTRPMPAVLNEKTDLYLYDYLQSKQISPYQHNVTFYKGDLHQHGIQNGKFGRYVNVPALSGNSDYGDANFGNTRGGALLEVIDRDSYRITSQAIWF